MATLMLFDVEFEIVKKSGGGQGSAYLNRRGSRRTFISAVSGHPKDILTVLNADITIPIGEVIEILSIRPVAVGTEGAVLS